jgi:hypothetical protein
MPLKSKQPFTKSKKFKLTYGTHLTYKNFLVILEIFMKSKFTIIFSIKQWVKMTEITGVSDKLASLFFKDETEREEKNKNFNPDGGGSSTKMSVISTILST